MISGARYHLVATYSVRKPVWSWSGSATLAKPKSQIWKREETYVNKCYLILVAVGSMWFKQYFSYTLKHIYTLLICLILQVHGTFVCSSNDQNNAFFIFNEQRER